MQACAKLREMSSYGGQRQTEGLPLPVVESFLESDPDLEGAINTAWESHKELQKEFPELLTLPENEQIQAVQEGYINFYDPYSVNPYLALAAKGPWIVTSLGAVLHDSGGYGMLGLGHSPEPILKAMNRQHVMANIMTASVSQKRLTEALHKEIGHSRSGEKRHPYEKFLCLNSGSEAVTVALRLSDIHAGKLARSGQEGKKVCFISLKGSFHGRTDRPSQVSDSCLGKYRKHLHSFQNRENLVTCTPNDVSELERIFTRASEENICFEAMFMEPVMGEGDPGKSITPEFYQAARKLTRKHQCLLIVDSIQAGLRTQGCLSIMDYPGFQEMDAPDMETYSKALNAGQYPLSVLALNPETAKLYITGVYGNTMTTNPRALDVACAVLAQVTPELRSNIRHAGQEFLVKFRELQQKFPSLVTKVQGTGLLFSLEVNQDKVKVTGDNGLEMKLRKKGIGVIHGGENSLRFTPHFKINSREITMITAAIEKELILVGENK